MRAVNDAVQDRVTERWIRNDVVPAGHRHLAGDQQRTLPFTVVNDLQQVPALLGVQRFGTPVVDDEQAGALEGLPPGRPPPFPPGGGGGAGNRGAPPAGKRGKTPPGPLWGGARSPAMISRYRSGRRSANVG